MIPCLFPSQKPGAISPLCLLGETGRVPGGKSHNIVGPPPPWIGPPGVFNSQICPHGITGNSITVRFSYPSTGSRGAVCSWVSALGNWDPLYLPLDLCNLGGRGSPCALPSLQIQDELLSGGSAFRWLLGGSGNFQAPYMLNWKPEVPLGREIHLNFIHSLSVECPKAHVALKL